MEKNSHFVAGVSNFNTNAKRDKKAQLSLGKANMRLLMSDQ